MKVCLRAQEIDDADFEALHPTASTTKTSGTSPPSPPFGLVQPHGHFFSGMQPNPEFYLMGRMRAREEGLSQLLHFYIACAYPPSATAIFTSASAAPRQPSGIHWPPVRGRLHIQQAQHAVVEAVMRQRRVGAGARQLDDSRPRRSRPPSSQATMGMLLHIGRHGIGACRAGTGRTFAQRLAMVTRYSRPVSYLQTGPAARLSSGPERRRWRRWSCRGVHQPAGRSWPTPLCGIRAESAWRHRPSACNTPAHGCPSGAAPAARRALALALGHGRQALIQAPQHGLVAAFATVAQAVAPCAPRLSAALACGTRSHTPLQPDWLSSHSTARPAAWATSSRFSYSLSRASNALLPSGENMQGKARPACLHRRIAPRASSSRRAWPAGRGVAAITVDAETVGARPGPPPARTAAGLRQMQEAPSAAPLRHRHQVRLRATLAAPAPRWSSTGWPVGSSGSA